MNRRLPLRIIFCLLIGSVSFYSCAQEKKSVTVSQSEILNEKKEEKNANVHLEKYRIIETDLGYDMNDIPLKRYELLMPNGQKLLIDTTQNKDEIPQEDYLSLGIPSTSVFAFTSFYAGVKTQYYATLEGENLTIFIQYLEENGDKSDPEYLRMYENSNNKWHIVSANKRNARIYRDENWHPEDGQYYFSEQFTYEYYNELYPEEDTRRKGTFSFYHDPYSGTILLRRYDSYMDEMIKYILIRPQKDYILGYTGEHRNSYIDTIAQDDFYKMYPNKHQQDVMDHFAQQYTLISDEENKYGNAYDYCIDSYPAKTYEVNYIRSEDKSKSSLANYPYDLTNLYMLQKSNAYPEGGLPINIANLILPGNKLIVEDEAVVNGKKVRFKLTCISATTYFLSL